MMTSDKSLTGENWTGKKAAENILTVEPDTGIKVEGEHGTQG